jgi:hypothetical protein
MERGRFYKSVSCSGPGPEVESETLANWSERRLTLESSAATLHVNSFACLEARPVPHRLHTPRLGRFSK